MASDLHNDFVSRLRKSQLDVRTEGLKFHKEKIQIVRDINKSVSKLLKSGPNNISRYSLDLMRRQKNMRGNNSDGTISEAALVPVDDVNMAEIALLAQYDDAELDKFLEDMGSIK